MTLVGYARVSTDDQDLGLQLAAFDRFSVAVVFQEKQSAVKDRPELQKCIASLRRGDILCVWKIDRLARSLLDLLEILRRVQLRGASFKSLTEPIDLTSALGNFFMQILGAFAELERNIIKERTMAGLEVARARGVRLGREASLSPQEAARCLVLVESRSVTRSALAREYGVHLSSIKRALIRAQIARGDVFAPPRREVVRRRSASG